MLKEKSDEELMLDYQLGDENAFRQLYARHSGRVLGFLRSKVRNDAKARDIFQATFLKLHKSRSRYNPALPFVPWLFTICRSELLDALKKERASKEDTMAVLPENSTSDVETAKEIDLSVLNDAQQEAIIMRFHRDFSFEEIAKTLNTSPANARQILSRALKALRSFYAKK